MYREREGERSTLASFFNSLNNPFSVRPLRFIKRFPKDEVIKFKTRRNQLPEDDLGAVQTKNMDEPVDSTAKIIRDVQWQALVERSTRTTTTSKTSSAPKLLLLFDGGD